MDVFYALAEPTRRSIIEMLAKQGHLSASSIHRHFRSTPSAVSQHLRVLREAQLVRMEKSAQQRIYRLNQPAVQEVEEWARQLSEQWEVRFSKLDALLKEERRKEKRNVRAKK